MYVCVYIGLYKGIPYNCKGWLRMECRMVSVYEFVVGSYFDARYPTLANTTLSVEIGKRTD